MRLANWRSHPVWAAITMAATGFGSSFCQGLLVHAHQTRSVTESVALFLLVIVVGLIVGALGDWFAGAIFAFMTYALGQVAQFTWLFIRSGNTRRALGQAG